MPGLGPGIHAFSFKNALGFVMVREGGPSTSLHPPRKKLVDPSPQRTKVRLRGRRRMTSEGKTRSGWPPAAQTPHRSSKRPLPQDWGRARERVDAAAVRPAVHRGRSSAHLSHENITRRRRSPPATARSPCFRHTRSAFSQFSSLWSGFVTACLSASGHERTSPTIPLHSLDVSTWSPTLPVFQGRPE